MSWTLIEKSTHSGPSAAREVRPPFSRAGGGHFCRHPRSTRFLRRLPRVWSDARPFQPCVPLRQHPQDLDDRRTATLLHRDAGCLRPVRTAATTLEPLIWEPQKLPDRNATTLPTLRGWLAVVVLGRALLQKSCSLSMLGGDWTDGTMTDFKWRHFQGDVILWAVRWYCRYPISYRDLEEMLAERGISVDHTTIYRWVRCYAAEVETRLRWFGRRGCGPSWRLDETYVKVRGKWTYLYRAVDKRGDTIDFYLSPTRSAKAAKRFLGKALRGLKHWEKPATLNTDKAPSYGAAITELKRE